MTKGRTIIKGALVLTFANLMTRVMGFVYRIYMSKAIGARGMGVYQLIIPVYMLVFSLCSSGFATAVSNCTAASVAKNDMGGARRMLHAALYITALLSLGACAAVFWGAGFIGKNLLHEPRTVLSLKIISLCFPFMSTGACLRGYFYGIQKMSVPAAAQMTEQSVRIGMVWLLYGTMLSRGLEYACAAAVMGMACGEMVSFLLTFFIYYIQRARLKKYTAITRGKAVETVLAMSLPLTLNRGMAAGLAAFENILIPQRLVLHGMSLDDAVGLFGGLCGMAVPLVMFPCSLLTALATAMMPAISEYGAQKNYPAVTHTLRRTMLFTTVIGIGGCSLFAAFPSEISVGVYGRDDIAAMLRFLGVMCPFLYTQVILSAALNGLNFQMYIFKMGLLGSLISIAAVYFLMPHYGIHAYIAGKAAAAVITNTLSAVKLKKTVGDFSTVPTVLLNSIIAAVFVCLFGRYFCRHFPPHGLMGLFVLMTVCAGTYLGILCLLGVFKKTSYHPA